MTSAWSALAAAVALSHLALIVVLVVGGPVALRHPRFVWVHIPAAVATAAVFALGADCPLTVWQKSLLRRAGTEPYDGGFIEHYLVEPLTGHGMTPTINAIILAAWLLPTLGAYGLRSRRSRRHPVSIGSPE